VVKPPTTPIRRPSSPPSPRVDLRGKRTYRLEGARRSAEKLPACPSASRCHKKIAGLAIRPLRRKDPLGDPPTSSAPGRGRAARRGGGLKPASRPAPSPSEDEAGYLGVEFVLFSAIAARGSRGRPRHFAMPVDAGAASRMPIRLSSREATSPWPPPPAGQARPGRDRAESRRLRFRETRDSCGLGPLGELPQADEGFRSSPRPTRSRDDVPIAAPYVYGQASAS
jgi:hypothetical protein